ncbi:MAG: 2-hydroxychromene-2-carboxylate isomerase, partial [Pirellulales bacterium]|nr:2-hydroxychromene-2-carboxylate isomerase [Pirellulales bacterium]
MTKPSLEFFFDCSSPWTYLAFSQIEDIADRCGADLIWRPILVGGVFNAVNQDVYETRAKPNPRKARYSSKDLKDWAKLRGIVIQWPSVFPVRAVDLMRGAIVAQRHDALPAFAWAAFRAYWGEDRDVSQPEELAALARAAGIDEAVFAEGLRADDVKAELKANTEELIERDGFGSPTMFINGDDMYFGNDRLEL